MDRYQRVEKQRDETPISENEIRITAQGRMRNYISYALTLLQEKEANEIVLKAMGRAINKTVMIVELVKRRVVGLHQITTTESIDITDVWEPLEEGLQTLETTRHVSMISVTLSKSELNTSAPGYQPPLPADQVRTLADFENDEEIAPPGRGRGRRGRGRGRRGGMSNNMQGYEGNNEEMQVYEGNNANNNMQGGYGYGYGRRGRGGYRGGRGRGPYRGGRGGGRGYYYNNSYNNNDEGNDESNYNENYADDAGQHDALPAPEARRGRVRGRGMGRGRGRGRAPPPQQD